MATAKQLEPQRLIRGINQGKSCLGSIPRVPVALDSPPKVISDSEIKGNCASSAVIVLCTTVTASKLASVILSQLSPKILIQFINQGQKNGSGGSLGVKWPWMCYPRSLWILASKATLLEVYRVSYLQ